MVFAINNYSPAGARLCYARLAGTRTFKGYLVSCICMWRYAVRGISIRYDWTPIYRFHTDSCICMWRYAVRGISIRNDWTPIYRFHTDRYLTSRNEVDYLWEPRRTIGVKYLWEPRGTRLSTYGKPRGTRLNIYGKPRGTRLNIYGTPVHLYN